MTQQPDQITERARPSFEPMTLDQVFPHSIDIEQALIGRVISDPTTLDAAAAIVEASDFFSVKHQLIWTVLTELKATDITPDDRTIADAFKTKPEAERVEDLYIYELMTFAGPARQVEVYAELIKRAAIRRAGMTAAQDAMRAFQSPDNTLHEAIDAAYTALRKATARNIKSKSISFARSIQNAYAASEQALTRKAIPPDYQSGIAEFDDLLSMKQFRKGKFYIVAGRPSMGKTDVLLHLAKRFSRQGKRVKLFELEMEESEVSARLASAEMRTPVDNIELGNLSDHEWEEYTRLVANADKYMLDIDDEPHQTMQSIETVCRAEQPDVILIDYLQLIDVKIEKGSNRERAVSEISRWAKTFARQMQAVLIMGCQLNRDLEKRQDKRPILADLRESGSLEQDADVVIGIYRDDQYNPSSAEPNTMEWILLKNRGGAKGFAKVYYNAACHVFGRLGSNLPRNLHYEG